MADQLSTLYGDLLQGSYDCVDRVILNACFTMGQTGGGLRTRWRALYGCDDNLDDNHLMRIAGRFSRRLRAWAKENNIPVVYSSPGERKHDIASEYPATHEVEPGLFMILVSKAPALVWEAQRTGTGKLGPLVPKQPALDPSPAPNCPIRYRSITTTKTSSPACAASFLNLGLLLKDRQFIFHLRVRD